MIFRAILLSLALAIQTVAQPALSMEQLTSFIRSSIQLKQDDRKVADYLKRVRLTNRLDDRAIEEFQGMGIGPRTTQALRDLAAASAGLPVAAAAAPKPGPPPIPPPSPEEQKRILAAATDHALNYIRGLPDFICTQVTRRYIDPRGLEFWCQQDVIVERLSYFDQREDYKVVLVNNHPADIPHEKLGGATSSGEFGSILKEIFEPKTGTDFNWARWATLRGRRTYVFDYRVPQSKSTYRITSYSGPATADSVVAGYRGLVYIDRDSRRVMQITLETEGLPSAFPIRQVNLTLVYDYTRIGEQDYVLPLKAELRSRDANRFLVKNEVEFRMYRKFGTEATIKFETPEPLPEETTKEEPVK
jgi:hypothetical protein